MQPEEQQLRLLQFFLDIYVKLSGLKGRYAKIRTVGDIHRTLIGARLSRNNSMQSINLPFQLSGHAPLKQKTQEGTLYAINSENAKQALRMDGFAIVRWREADTYK